MRKKRKSGTKGFTLLEMIVAVGVFGIIAVLASSSTFMFHRLHRKAINAQNVQDNVRFALDTMAREIRFGDKFCDTTVPCLEVSPDGINDCDWAAGVPGNGGCKQFSFRESLVNVNVAYRLNASAPGGGAIQKSIDNGANWYYVTDPERTISRLRMYGTGISTDPLDTVQERITIVIEVESAYLAKPGEESKLLLQTTLTKRKITP